MTYVKAVVMVLLAMAKVPRLVNHFVFKQKTPVKIHRSLSKLIQ